jgi:glycosyltransferase involved in cell wall biosynthesis
MGIKDKVTFAGLIPRVEVFRQLAEASLFVSASSREGMPIAVLEAMACKCPVILSDIPPHREISQRLEFIPLIKPHNIEGLAQTIKKIIEMPDCQRIELGEKCRKLAEKRFSLEAMHEGYNNVYREVIKI